MCVTRRRIRVLRGGFTGRRAQPPSGLAEINESFLCLRHQHEPEQKIVFSKKNPADARDRDSDALRGGNTNRCNENFSGQPNAGTASKSLNGT